MIVLIRPPAPPVLTEQFVAAGVARYAQDAASVWDVADLKAALSEMSNGKCAYCEVRLGEGPAYLEVEHFYAKTHHPGRVLDWNNLLPACRRCNGRKGDWDVALPGQMMIDPTTENPATHIRFDEAYRPVAVTPLGETAILEIALDDIARLGVMRYKVGEIFKRKLEDLNQSYAGINAATTNRQKRLIIRRIKDALGKCRPDEPFSAVLATVAFRSEEYAALKDAMNAGGDWDAELEVSDEILVAAALA